MNNNQNKPQEVSQVKSVEEITLNQCKDEIAVKQGYKSWKTMYPKVHAYKLLILSDEAAEMYAAQFQSRIAELEKQNAVYMEALEIAIKEIKYQYRQKGKSGGEILNRIEQALNTKDNQ